MLIGIMGYKGSGKDTVADILKNILKPEHEKFAFANKIKSDLSKIFDTPLSIFYNRDIKDNGYIKINNMDLDKVNNKFRELYPYGTLIPFYKILKDGGYLKERKLNFIKRIFGRKKLVWDLKIPIRNVMQLYGTEFMQGYFGSTVWLKNAPAKDTIITDVRFPHEINFIKNNGGVIVKVLNLQQLDKHVKNESKEEDNHQSESFFSLYKEQDYVIINDGVNINALVREIYNFLEELEKDGLYER